MKNQREQLGESGRKRDERGRGLDEQVTVGLYTHTTSKGLRSKIKKI